MIERLEIKLTTEAGHQGHLAELSGLVQRTVDKLNELIDLLNKVDLQGAAREYEKLKNELEQEESHEKRQEGKEQAAGEEAEGQVNGQA